MRREGVGRFDASIAAIRMMNGANSLNRYHYQLFHLLDTSHKPAVITCIKHPKYGNDLPPILVPVTVIESITTGTP